MIDVLALEGIRRVAAALPRAYADGADAAARADLLLAAWWSGLALSHCGLGAAHALAGPLGGSFPVPHGFACAATIAAVMDVNLRAADRDPAGADVVRRYADVARAMGESGRGPERAVAQAGAARVAALCEALRVPKLSAFGVTRAAIPDLAARARRTSSMKANPADLADADLAEILERSIA
jgi:alcohol dehydrogenase class IV